MLDNAPYLAWSTGALRPAALVRVGNEIVHGRRTRVVECGSGMSTVVLARLLRQQDRGATITSLEHDPDWAALVTDLLRRESLHTIARIVPAPLQGDPPWYRDSAMTEIPESVDLLIVDGPPAFSPGHELRRRPALGVFDPRLTAEAAVFLDDVDRPGEQQILTEWQRRYAWRFAVDSTAGIARGTRRT